MEGTEEDGEIYKLGGGKEEMWQFFCNFGVSLVKDVSGWHLRDRTKDVD